MDHENPKEAKIQLLELLEEQARRLRAAQTAYRPNGGQLPVHRSTKQTRLVLSGNGAGKTALSVNEAAWAALGYNPVFKQYTPVPSRVVVVIDHPAKSDDVWIPELRKWFDTTKWRFQKRGTHHISAILFPNGSEIVFFSHAMDPLAFESIELDMLVCDEPPPRHVYIGLFRGGRKKGRKLAVLIVGTPITGSWLRREVFDPWTKGAALDTECFRFGTSVNASNLATGYIESFGSKLSEKEKRIRLEGEFFDLDGLALAHLLDRAIHVTDPPEDGWPADMPVVIAIDPHPTKEHVACALGCDKEGYLFYIKETSRKLPARLFAQHLKEWARGMRVIEWTCDSLGQSQGTGNEGFMSFIQVCNEELGNGRVRATSWDEKSDEDFIERLREALLIPQEADNFGNKIPKLRFSSECHGIWQNVESAQWVKNRLGNDYKPKLDISMLDYLSCLKYALAKNLTPHGASSKILSVAKRDGLYNLPTAPKGQARQRRALQLKARSETGGRQRARRREGWDEF